LTYRSMIIAVAALAAPAMIAAPALAQSTPALAQSTAEAKAVAVLDGYRGALEALSASRAETFFWPDAQVFEQGGVEGSISQYLSHHLAPELEEFSSFTFQDHVTKATVVGDIAYATETYRFRIAFKTAGRAPVERRGVATSVLRLRDGEWRIVSYHSSTRAPRPAS
jgi:ketosteroid isomerase-like protein